VATEPYLSILIPTLNRGKLFHDTVRQCLTQSFVDFELIIIDQSDPAEAKANRDLVAELADERIVYMHLKTKGLPNARNEGMAIAQGAVWLFLDDDVILLGDVLQAHVDAYANPDVGGVTGRIVERTVRPNVDDTRNEVSAGGRILTNLWGAEACEIQSCKGANMSYRAAACRRIGGGFDRMYTGTALLEDTDFSERIRADGWVLWFEPAAELVHLSALQGGVRVEDALRTEYWRFRNCTYWMLKHRGPKHLPRLVATYMGIALKRSAEWQEPKALFKLTKALGDGVMAWRKGADQELPLG
jgi:GT2 family glycosyltransferase